MKETNSIFRHKINQICEKAIGILTEVEVALFLRSSDDTVSQVIGMGMADGRAVKMMETNPEVLAIMRLEELNTASGDEELPAQILARKKALSNAQLFALTNLKSRRLEETTRKELGNK